MSNQISFEGNLKELRRSDILDKNISNVVATCIVQIMNSTECRTSDELSLDVATRITHHL